ncbi:winged helix-turn-helix transcriptional regulator [Roseateles saccharophilus]|uniref:HxlR family transcriptional regulator n=1 Tax=Roseateles saccharophilus TaxID=304 RepID=A0A4V2VS86_ROSSA|nr:helix-turn-helix domain-containing protein [Roseateles saccharophilus]MDG0831598.1 transcriptional regulator [Roseateles saccharophilus]TCV00990.1 HxlR family transcriptional regulator [Roseateles saccharophilus]
MTTKRLARLAAAESPPSGKDAINAALELFQRRWTLRILWELRAEDASLNFRALQAACGDLSASVLNQRLTELREALLVEHDAGSGYRLGAQGRSLLVAIAPLLQWAPRWAREVQKAGNAG